MSRFKDSHQDRQKAARQARQAMAERFAARPGADAPETLERNAVRQAVVTAREARHEEAEQRRRSEKEELIRQQAADAALVQERVDQEARDASEQAEHAEALKVAQKVARDTRYAARKARK